MVELSNQVYGLISLQQSPVLKGIIRLDIKYYLIILFIVIDTMYIMFFRSLIYFIIFINFVLIEKIRYIRV